MRQVTPAHVLGIEIVLDVPSIETYPTEIYAVMEENMAVGVVSRGKVGAIIRDGTPTTGMGVIRGGKIFLRVREFVTSQENISITYLDDLDRSRQAAVTVPAACLAGSVLSCLMEDPDDRAVKIIGIDYSGNNSYDILLGIGMYPYLWNMPRRVQVSVGVQLRKEMTASPDLEERIGESVRQFLTSLTIGDNLEYSDLLKWVYNDHIRNVPFTGIDEIISCTVVGGAIIMNQLGDKLVVENDERIEPGDISVTVEKS